MVRPPPGYIGSPFLLFSLLLFQHTLCFVSYFGSAFDGFSFCLLSSSIFVLHPSRSTFGLRSCTPTILILRRSFAHLIVTVFQLEMAQWFLTLCLSSKASVLLLRLRLASALDICSTLPRLLSGGSISSGFSSFPIGTLGMVLSAPYPFSLGHGYYFRGWISPPLPCLDVHLPSLLRDHPFSGESFSHPSPFARLSSAYLSRGRVGRPIMDDIHFKKISEGKMRWLEREFSEREILAALGSIEGDKAPGPDYFNFKFIKACWNVVGPDFLKVFKEFYEHGIINKGLENSFVTLIPK